MHMRSFLTQQWRLYPWRGTFKRLRTRAQEDRLSTVAAGLAFSSVLGLVPLMTMGLAVFTAFPVFDELRVTLEKWLLHNLVPATIARQLLGYLNDFASRALQLGSVSLLVLGLSAFSLVFTLDHALNRIWRNPASRPLCQRVLLYWALLTLGPLLWGLSLWLNAIAFSNVSDWLQLSGRALRPWADVLSKLLMVVGLAAVYRFVPYRRNQPVAWSHALLGALFAGIALAITRSGLVWVLTLSGSMRTVYGAFAILPMLLLWLYIAWLVVLWGAAIAAWLPILRHGVARGDTVQDHIALWFDVLQSLEAARQSPARGLSADALAQQLRAAPVPLAQVLDDLQRRAWVVCVDEIDAQAPRYVLLEPAPWANATP